MTTNDIIISGIISVLSCAIYDLIKFYFIKLKVKSIFFNSQITRVLRFVIGYVVPISSIVLLLTDKTEPNFFNIGSFITIAIFITYNILMSHIIKIYKMIIELTQISSKKTFEIDSTFTTVYNQITQLKRDNDLK